MDIRDTFLTTSREVYSWPYPKPLISKAAQPPLSIPRTTTYKHVEPYCHCDHFLYEPQLKKYQKLSEKESFFHDELDILRKRMNVLVSDIINKPCETEDEKLETIYQTDYVKRELNLAKYRSLVAAINSPVGIPVKGEAIGLGTKFKDPTKFQYHVIRQNFEGVCPTEPVQREQTPADKWFERKTGDSEYEDSFNRMGEFILRCSQRITYPLPGQELRSLEDERCKERECE